VLTDQQLWTPALNHWFPGLTPAVVGTLTCQQIMDSYRFIQRNSKAE